MGVRLLRLPPIVWVLMSVSLVTLDEEREEEVVDEKIVNEEYKTWKKNAPFLYDLMLSNALEWPTLTTQWLPDKQEFVHILSSCHLLLLTLRSVPEKDYCLHRLLIGTHTSNEAQNYLQIAAVQLPKPVAPDSADYDEESEEIGGYGGGASTNKPAMEVKFDIVQKIDHKGEVNKARYMPQNPNMIATMCTDGRVMIWDRTKHPSLPTGTVNPQMELIGHEAEGFGLSWSPHIAGHLATGSEDQTVRLWYVVPSLLHGRFLRHLGTLPSLSLPIKPYTPPGFTRITAQS